MIIIYNCYGGTHSSVLSAAVHLNRLPGDRVPEKQAILGLEYFNKLDYKDMGRLIFHGTDEDGNKVYTIGRGTSRVIIPALRSLVIETLKLSGPDERFAFINSSPTVPLMMTLGGFFSRGLHIHFIGVPLLVAGARQTHFNIVNLVNRTKELCRDKSNSCTVIDIDNKGNINFYN